jgi:hypothetical protein
MSSTPEFAQYVCDQIRNIGTITIKKMFGEYGIYCNEKIFGLICNDQLFVRICPTGKNPNKLYLEEKYRSLLDETITPFPDAKHYGCMSGDLLEDGEKASEICRAVVDMLIKK